MNLSKRVQVYRPPQFQGTGILGTTQLMQIDQSYPLEGISITVNATVGSTGLTFPTSPANVQQVDNIYSLIQNVNLSVVEPTGQRTVVNMSGAALIELNEDLGGCVDPAPLAFIASTTIAANQNFRLTYFVPIVPMCMGEDLRTRHLLPIHLYPQPPQLAIQFGTFSNISSTGSFAECHGRVASASFSDHCHRKEWLSGRRSHGH